MHGAVSNGKIVAVAERIPVESARRLVDAAGLYGLYVTLGSWNAITSLTAPLSPYIGGSNASRSSPPEPRSGMTEVR
jgi:hypothetical protein